MIRKILVKNCGFNALKCCVNIHAGSTRDFQSFYFLFDPPKNHKNSHSRQSSSKIFMGLSSNHLHLDFPLRIVFKFSFGIHSKIVLRKFWVTRACRKYFYLVFKYLKTIFGIFQSDIETHVAMPVHKIF